MVRVLDLLEDYLRWQKLPFERIDGSVKGNERQVKAFARLTYCISRRRRRSSSSSSVLVFVVSADYPYAA